jgi:hypothetical protein
MTVFATGIDYAWVHPDPAAIAAAGYKFACRYYSRDPSKNLTRPEANNLAAEGLWIVGNWEYYANDALGGYAAGVANAKLARQLADACGQPAPRPIYGSDDWDVTPAQESTITDYLRGWDSVLGVGEVGEYAGFYPLRVQRDAGVTSWEWQPRAWSGGQWEPRVNIVQTGTAMVGGVQVDTNEAWTADYGQWQPGRLPDIIGGSMTPDQEAQLLNQVDNLYLAMFSGGPSCGTQPTGAPNNSLVSKQDYVIAQTDALSGAVAKIVVPTVPVGDLANAVKTALLDPTVAKFLAHALAVELHNDTPAT